MMRRAAFLGLLAALAAIAWGGPLFGAEKATASAERDPLSTVGIAVGAGLAVGIAGLGTAIAQARIGPAAVGALTENPKLLGAVFLLLVIPETIVILGFVVAFLLTSG